jgi:hypothetical protein
MPGVLKQRTALRDPDRQNVFGGPRPFRASVKNPKMKVLKLLLAVVSLF